MKDDAATAIVLWLRDEALAVPIRSGWKGLLWALAHPFRFYQESGRFFALVRAANAIERGGWFAVFTEHDNAGSGPWRTKEAAEAALASDYIEAHRLDREAHP